MVGSLQNICNGFNSGSGLVFWLKSVLGLCIFRRKFHKHERSIILLAFLIDELNSGYLCICYNPFMYEGENVFKKVDKEIFVFKDLWTFEEIVHFTTKIFLLTYNLQSVQMLFQTSRCLNEPLNVAFPFIINFWLQRRLLADIKKFMDNIITPLFSLCWKRITLTFNLYLLWWRFGRFYYCCCLFSYRANCSLRAIEVLRIFGHYMFDIIDHLFSPLLPLLLFTSKTLFI